MAISRSQALKALAPPTLLWRGCSVALIGYSGWQVAAGRAQISAAVLLLCLGSLLWTLAEYAVHRWLEHITPQRKPLWPWLVRDHSAHHYDPEDIEDIVLSLPRSALIIFMTALVLSPLLLEPAYFGATAAGFILAYLVYEWVHMASHAPSLFGGRVGIMQRWSSHHASHHWQSARKNYGFVTPLWDHVFGTYMAYKQTSDRR